MSEKKTCPKCGNELPLDAPAGVCPKCLLEAGLLPEVPEAMNSANDVTLPPVALDNSNYQILPPTVRDDVETQPRLHLEQRFATSAITNC